jgi:hypothetical protein
MITRKEELGNKFNRIVDKRIEKCGCWHRIEMNNMNFFAQVKKFEKALIRKKIMKKKDHENDRNNNCT